jgi:hypothetical protein
MKMNMMLPVPSAGVAWYVIGRVLIGPDGKGEEAGFFVFLNGLDDELFSGEPSERTAHFTVRSDPFTIRTFQNGDLQATLLSRGTFRLYYNEHPQADFSDPETFSKGKVIAEFERVKAMLVTVAGVTSDVFWATRTKSHDFHFKGKRFNLKDAVPHGITEIGTASSTPMPGNEKFPVMLPFVGSSLAVGDTSGAGPTQGEGGL